MITSNNRGHPITFNGQGWVYVDDNSPADNDRPCIRCGRPPTPEGYDACLGSIAGAGAVCCGHGVHEKVIVYAQQAQTPLLTTRLPRVNR